MQPNLDGVEWILHCMFSVSRETQVALQLKKEDLFGVQVGNEPSSGSRRKWTCTAFLTTRSALQSSLRGWLFFPLVEL